MKFVLTLAIVIYLPVAIFAQEQAPQLGKASVKEVIAAMTLQEKAKLVVGMGFKMPGAAPVRKAAVRRR